MTTIITSTVAVLTLTATGAFAENVEIYATDILDNTQDGYCVDISGAQGDQADPADGLQGHRCYSPSGEIYVDQAFDSEEFADGVLYMPEFAVCAQAASMDTGAEIDLMDCDGSDAQNFIFTGKGTISLAAAPGMCLTLGENTRPGRSDTNQIKELTLEECSDDAANYQSWGNRTAD
ncbi:ricin-type beta-trefoil lectin domain protein [Sulfitobacter sp. AS92]|uniref:ricin-type beta-trefoil lectin domain protein n=1 Tax=Sulfitobacter sp. AS92 TaxID=3135783 RepID=UPI003182187C